MERDDIKRILLGMAIGLIFWPIYWILFAAFV